MCTDRPTRPYDLTAVTTLDSARPSARAAAYVRSPSGIYAVVMALFCGLLLISNVAATKLITVVDGLPVWLGGGIFTDGGALLFPLTYILGDVLAEVYGLRQARRAIWVGFALAALAAVTFLAVGAAPPGPGYENQDAFVAVLGFVPRIVLASLVGYLAGQFLNAYVLVRLKDRSAERGLVGRLVGSTVVGELADTVLFCVIAFAGVFPTWGSLIGYTVIGYLYKVAVEVILLPVTLLVIRAIKKREPEYAAARRPRPPAVRQLRLVVAVPDYDAAVRFYRDELGLAGGAVRRRGRRAGDDPGCRAGDAGAVQPGPDRLHRHGGDRPDGGQPALRVAFEVDDCAAVTDTADRRRGRAGRPADAYAVGLAELPAAGPGRGAADRVHRAGWVEQDHDQRLSRQGDAVLPGPGGRQLAGVLAGQRRHLRA